jgi:hypothetical protein
MIDLETARNIARGVLRAIAEKSGIPVAIDEAAIEERS